MRRPPTTRYHPPPEGPRHPPPRGTRSESSSPRVTKGPHAGPPATTHHPHGLPSRCHPPRALSAAPSGLECSKNDINSCVTRIRVKNIFLKLLGLAEVIRNPDPVHNKGQGCIWARSMAPKLRIMSFFVFSLNFFHFIKQKFSFKNYILFGAQRIKRNYVD